MRESWSKFQAAVAAHGDSARRAFQKFVIRGLTPAARVLGSDDACRCGEQSRCADPSAEPLDTTTRARSHPFSSLLTAASSKIARISEMQDRKYRRYRIGKFNEMTPVTGPD